MIRCAVCNTIKEETGNHWWALYLSLSMPADVMGCTTVPLAACAGVARESYVAACGNNHAQTLYERWLQTGSFDMPRANAAGGAA